MEELTADQMRPEPKRLLGAGRRTGHLGPQLEKQTERQKTGKVNQIYRATFELIALK